MKKLIPHSILNKVAKIHCADTGVTGMYGHFGSNK